MKNKQRKDQIPFTQIPNALICDKNISAGAKAVYSYMQSKPDDWTFYNNDIKKSLDIGANKTLARYFKELITNGWISRSRKQVNGKMSGGYDYTVHFDNILTNTEKLHIRQSSIYGKRYNHTNKESFNNKEKNNNKEKAIRAKYSDFDYCLTKDFLEYQFGKYPKLVRNKKKDIERGADTLRLLRTQDNFTEKEITDTLRFALRDEFWKDKIISVATLRKRSRNGNTKFQNIYQKYINKPKTKTEQVMEVDLSKKAEIWNI